MELFCNVERLMTSIIAIDSWGTRAASCVEGVLHVPLDVVMDP
jgi:hypothetical protein